MAEKKNEKPGGSRTFSLVCLGSTLISIIGLELNKTYPALDIYRLLQGAIQGISFIGAGIIMQNKNKIEGLTTASSIWVAVPLGLLVGLGYYLIAVLASILVWVILESKYTKIGRKHDKRTNNN